MAISHWVEYFDLAHEIAKWHFSLVDALSSSKYWKSKNGAISWTEWNIVMKFCIHIDINKMYPMRLSNDIWDWLRFLLPRFKFWKKWDYCKMTFIIGQGFAQHQILKKWKWPYLSDWVEYFDRLLRRHWYYQDLAQEIVKCHFSSVEVLPSSKFWKSENGHVSWTEWDIVMKFCIHIGIVTRCSPWDCQMTFGIGWGFAEVQILKEVKINF